MKLHRRWGLCWRNMGRGKMGAGWDIKMAKIFTLQVDFALDNVSSSHGEMKVVYY